MKNRIRFLIFLLLTLTIAKSQSIQVYEYWLDDDYNNRTTVLGGSINMTLYIDVGDIQYGLHYFNFRAKDDDGIWGPQLRTLAYIPEDTTPAIYEYWIDNDFEGRVTTNASTSEPFLSIDGSHLKTGLHYFNFRVKDASGMWGPLKRELFRIEFKNMPITGYQYAVDSTKVDVQLEECTEYTLNNLEIDLSDAPGLGSLEKGCSWNFNKAKSEVTLYRKNNLTFLIKFKNKANEWSIPEGETLEFPDTVTKPMYHLKPGPQIKIAKVEGGDFAPLAITATESRDYYLQATQPCKMHLFDGNGNLLKTIGSDALLQGEKTAMTAGTYYGVVYNTQKDEAHPADSLHLLLALEAHTALTPTITHRKDTVYIVSEQTDAELYYTIDNTTPTTQSTRYTKPFNLTHNATVRAIAAGSGYAASAEAVSEIDPFKVENVTFVMDGYMLTLLTETEQATIYYTTDGKTPTVNSTKYERPVPLSGSCTIKAYAVRTGYTDSEMTSYVFDAGPVTVIKPQLSHEGNIISIVTETEESAIYYTTDGNNPTAESTRYTGPFAAVQNGTIKAIAKRDKYFDSPIGSLAVNWFKVADVQFMADGYMLTMKTDTTNAVIYYTTDGTTPNAKSTRYEQPIALMSACIVKAIAMRENFTNSEVTQYQFVPSSVTVAAPKVEHIGNTAVINTTTESANIYYTLDGTDPTAESMLYEKPFDLVENGTLKAIAIRKNYFNSPIASMTVDWFKVDTVAFSTNGYEVSMTTTTPDATIHFTTDGTTPTTTSAKYNGPVALTTQCTVTAFAVKKNFNNSDITYFNFHPGAVTVAQPQIVNEGNVISIKTATEGATIYYTTDGTEPTIASTLYENPFTVSRNCTVLAIAIKDKYINSSTGKLEVNWFKVADVAFAQNGYVLTMSSPTEGATIYYTKDGSAPTSTSDKYVEPITLTEKCTVRALAVKDGFNNSDVTAFEFNPDKVTVATPMAQRIGTSNFIELSTTTAGASIYYTTDGTMPTAERGTLYTQAFEVARNCIVKAIGVRENYNSSQVAELTVDWFRVEKVQFVPNGYVLTMVTETSDAIIHYTIDDSEPTADSPIYTGPIMLQEDCTVKAIGMKEGYHDSEVASFSFVPSRVTVSRPVIDHTGNVVFISTETEGAAIWYTLDGTIPSAENGTLYTRAFEVDRNCTIKAIGVKDDYYDSPIGELAVDWFRVATPTFVLDGTTLSISCKDEKAAIYYSIGEDAEPSSSSTRYTGPIVLTDNKPVKAIAVIEGYQDSEVAVFAEKPVTSLGVDMAYNGHFITLTAKEAEATVYYTTDGTNPTEASDVYDGPIALNSLLTVRAAAMRPYTNMSATQSYEVTYVYDGRNALVKESGSLAKAFDWCGAAQVETLCISGPIGNTDMATIRSLQNLRVLDLEQAELDGQMLPEEAFKGTPIRWFVSPEKLSGIGRNVFADCQQLAAVTWQTYAVQLTAEAFGEHLNPNMLYFVKSENMVTIDDANIISNGHARTIVLHDGTTYCDFYCPTSFWADDVSYKRSFGMKTKQGVCQGWETLTLPFDVQNVSHWKNGEMVPFAARGQGDDRKPFWLAKLEDRGFVSTGSIEANTPYIISMPNDSATYADRNLLAGEVTFTAKNAEVKATDVETCQGKMGDVLFVPNYASSQASGDIYAINLMEEDGHLEGSSFLPNNRSVRPFEAYTVSLAARAPRYIAIEEMTGTTTGIVDIQADYGYLDKNVVRVFNLNGLLVKEGPHDDVMKQLPKGVYIINGRKMIVK